MALLKLMTSSFAYGMTLLLFAGIPTQADNAETLSDSLPQISFESFLRNPPKIQNAQFDIQTPISAEQIKSMKEFAKRFDMPRVEAHPELFLISNTVCSLRINQTNYILSDSAMKTDSGSFGNIEWELTGRTLNLFDRQINKPNRNWSAEWRGASRPIRRFLNLGIEDMDPSTLDWTNGTDHFTAECIHAISGIITNIDSIQVKLRYLKGVPLTATVQYMSGRRLDITYAYEPSFFGGHLPVGFDVANTSADPDSLTKEYFSLHISKLQLSESSIDTVLFDPKKVLHGEFDAIVFASNNVEYVITKREMVTPVLTAQQAVQIAQSNRVKQHPRAKIAFMIVLIIVGLALPITLILGKILSAASSKPGR